MTVRILPVRHSSRHFTKPSTTTKKSNVKHQHTPQELASKHALTNFAFDPAADSRHVAFMKAKQS